MGELTPARYGLSAQDSYSSVHELVSGTSQGSLGTLEQIQNHLESIYCGSSAVDFSGIEVRKNAHQSLGGTIKKSSNFIAPL